MIEEEPISEKVRGEVDRAAERQEVQHFRRAADRRDYWVKTWSTVLVGILLAAVTGLSGWLFSVRDTQKMHDLNIVKNTSDITEMKGDIRDLQSAKNNNASLEKTINAQFKVIEDRISDQDKRQQMQGEGLIAGNKSIHEILQRMIGITGEFDFQSKRLDRLERQQDDTPLNVPSYKRRTR